MGINRVAKRLIEMAGEDLHSHRERNRELALKHFDYVILRHKIQKLLNSL